MKTPLLEDFPDTSTALTEPNGLLAAGGDLSPRRLICAYSRGIFPWFDKGQPILWWTPNPRMVLLPRQFRVSRSFRKRLRLITCQVTVNKAFDEVVAACAAPRKDDSGTWILPEMHSAYAALHTLGVAHSVEVWLQGKLVGGLYGLAMGRVFFGESMFSRISDASKIAFAALAAQLNAGLLDLVDCQVHNSHLARLGALEISRQDFENLLFNAIKSDTDWLNTVRRHEPAVWPHKALPSWLSTLPTCAEDVLGELN